MTFDERKIQFIATLSDIGYLNRCTALGFLILRSHLRGHGGLRDDLRCLIKGRIHLRRVEEVESAFSETSSSWGEDICIGNS